MKHPLRQAEFVLTAAQDDQLPPPGLPEIAFAGRSNAGKSSAINALVGVGRLAFTSKTPGRTQQINFFKVRAGALLADLPGYGYAAVPMAVKRHWQDFLARYIAMRQSLVGLVLVIDARHGVDDLDLKLLQGYLPSGRPVLVLATKMDKLTVSAQRNAARAAAAAIAAAFPVYAGNVTVVPFSAVKKFGVDEAEAAVAAWLGIPHDTTIVATQKERAPRSRGVTGDPKRPA